MVSIYVAALMALGSASGSAQAPAPAVAPVPIEPSVDSAEVRRSFDQLSVCLAEARPGWARRALAHPYLSDGQARVASEALRGTDRCLDDDDDLEFTFRTSGMIASLAEHYLRAHLPNVDFDEVVMAIDTMAPRNASEDFAFCLAARNPVAARNLSFSALGSPEEIDAARQLSRTLAPCFNPGEDLTVDLQSLRALSSSALYRGVTAVEAGRSYQTAARP
jgi:hypothetical protein